MCILVHSFLNKVTFRSDGRGGSATTAGEIEGAVALGGCLGLCFFFFFSMGILWFFYGFCMGSGNPSYQADLHLHLLRRHLKAPLFVSPQKIVSCCFSIDDVWSVGSKILAFLADILVLSS